MKEHLLITLFILNAAVSGAIIALLGLWFDGYLG